MRRSLRLGCLRPRVALLVVAAALAAAPLGGAAGNAPPKGTQPVTILYTGVFRMSNVAQPQTTAASYDYSVTWTYWWTGTWSSLFRDPSVFTSSPVAFTKVKKLSTGGTSRYEKAWSWRHTFAAASGQVPFRAYKARMRSGVTVYYRPCRLITACARAKP